MFYFEQVFAFCMLINKNVFEWFLLVMLCAIWYHLYNLKNVKNTHGRVLLYLACNFTKSNTLPWVFFTFFKLYKWDQIVQSIAKNMLCPDLQTFLVESIPHCFWLIREGCQMPNTEPLLYQTEKNSYWTCSIKKAVLKNFAIFT